MALDRDKMIAAIAGGLKVNIYKSSIANLAGGMIVSLWRSTGSPQWQQGAIPGAAANPTDDTAGGIILPSFGSATGRVYRFAPISQSRHTIYLYDRIGHMGGLSGTVTTPQTVNLAVETPKTAGRCLTDYSNIEWYVEIYTDIGTTTADLTVTYTDKNDIGSKTITITGFSGASPLNRFSRCVRLVPSDGVAIKSVQSVQLSGTTGTAGSFGITARVYVCFINQMSSDCAPIGPDAISLGFPEIKDTTCLEMLLNSYGGTTTPILGDLLIGNISEA